MNSSIRWNLSLLLQLAILALLIVPGQADASCPPYKPGNSPLEILARHAPQSGRLTPEQLRELVRKGDVPALSVVPLSGLAPLTVGIEWLDYPVESPSRIEFDVDGDGKAEWSQARFETDPEKRRYTYQREGQYLLTVRVHDRTGQIKTYSVQITVFSLPALDADLRSRWFGLKTALRQGDVPAALECIHSESRERYQPVFEALVKSGKPIDQYLTDIRLIETGPGGAQYEMLRERDGKMFSFAVWFLIDWDGVWRLRRF